MNECTNIRALGGQIGGINVTKSHNCLIFYYRIGKFMILLLMTNIKFSIFIWLALKSTNSCYVSACTFLNLIKATSKSVFEKKFEWNKQIDVYDDRKRCAQRSSPFTQCSLMNGLNVTNYITRLKKRPAIHCEWGNNTWNNDSNDTRIRYNV